VSGGCSPLKGAKSANSASQTSWLDLRGHFAMGEEEEKRRKGERKGRKRTEWIEEKKLLVSTLVTTLALMLVPTSPQYCDDRWKYCGEEVGLVARRKMVIPRCVIWPISAPLPRDGRVYG